jgi:hypothetical protein
MLEFEEFPATNIRRASEAPDAPGLYVWFGRLRLGEADWKSANAGGQEAARENLWRSLSEHCAKYGKQEIDVKAVANFGTIWTGRLHEQIAKRWSQIMRGALSDEMRSLFDRVHENDESRELLVRVLDQAFPKLLSPLYLGKTTQQTLAERLTQHANRFLELWDQAAFDEELASKLGEPKSFAERAFSMGFTPDDLHFSCLAVRAVQGAGVSLARLEDAISAAEWILNRWNTPLLGKE